MSIYGNILREADEIDYMCKIAILELYAIGINESTPIEVIQEGIDFKKIKERAIELITDLLKKLKKVGSWLMSKAKVIAENISKRFKMLKSNNSKPLKQEFIEVKKQLATEQKNESASVLSEGVTMNEYNDFMNSKTRIGSGCTIDRVIEVINEYINDHEGEEDDKYISLADYCKDKRCPYPFLEYGGTTIEAFILVDFESKINKLDEFKNHLDILKKRLDEQTKCLEKYLSQVKRAREEELSSSNVNGLKDLLNFADANNESKKEQEKMEYVLYHQAPNTMKKITEGTNAFLEYEAEVLKVYKKCVDFLKKVKGTDDRSAAQVFSDEFDKLNS